MFGSSAEQLGRRFVVAQLTPAALLCAGLSILALPELSWLGSPTELTWLRLQFGRFGETPVVFSATAVLAAILISQYERTFTRIAEGYLTKALGIVGATLILLATFSAGWNWWTKSQSPLPLALAAPGLVTLAISVAQTVSRKGHVAKYLALEEEWRNEKDRLAKFTLERQITEQYPRDANYVRPTRFGNTYRAAEYYPHYMFNVDAVTMWPRLMAVVPQDYQRSLDSAETSVAFSINMCFAAVTMCTTSMYAAFRTGSPSAWVATSLFAVLATGMYRLACSGVRGWAEYIRAAFDLYRLDLLQQLRVVWPVSQLSNREEADLWRLVQRMTFYGHKPDSDTPLKVQRPPSPDTHR
jgi:hypothetical protein